MSHHQATAEVRVHAPRTAVWAALTDPDVIASFMMGARVETSWVPGDPITWTGVARGRPFQDTGRILRRDPPAVLEMTHLSGGQDDVPENHHRVRYELTEVDGSTRLTVTQDNNPTREAADHSAGTWKAMLDALARIVEQGLGPGSAAC